MKYRCMYALAVRWIAIQKSSSVTFTQLSSRLTIHTAQQLYLTLLTLPFSHFCWIISACAGLSVAYLVTLPDAMSKPLCFILKMS
jgi:hypothetical protein